MNRSRVTTGAATGMTLVLALAACGDTGTENEEPMEPETNQEEQETTPEESPDETGMEDMEDSDDAGGMDDMDDMDNGDDAETDGADDGMEDSDAAGDLSAVMPEGTGDPFADARTAAQHMPGSAENLAVGFSNALEIPGEPQSEAAQLRGDLTAMFQEHVYLAGIGVATAYEAGPDSEEFELAMETVDANSVAMADAVGELRAEQAEVQAGFAQEQAQQITDALLDPSAEVVSDDLPDGSRGIAVLGEDSALFAARDMTQLQDQDYQLWVLEGEEATSAGVLDWQEGELTASVEQFPADAALAVTAEPIGGSEQPTTDPLMVLGSP